MVTDGWNRDGKICLHEALACDASKFIDVGACQGDDTVDLLNTFPEASAVAFEAQPSNVAALMGVLKEAGLEGRCWLLCAILAGMTGPVIWYEPEAHGSTGADPEIVARAGSVYEPFLMPSVYPWFRYRRNYGQQTRLDSYQQCIGARLMVVDVNGAELDVLQGMGTLIRDVQAVVVTVYESVLYRMVPNRARVAEYLTRQGFVLVDKQGNAARTRLLYGR